ncbi:hypothetical protein B9Z55_015168 [Caenorhabditis nigoni]|uniref:Uncharacterized protein n=2 Tax=Caenorhabditis nigoni TaxID=1611254 RepID=A0A2G5U8Z2_9PELO|nr:hypothetical protein B9Z55_015168 [Caenorhabditis nigoni]
MKFALPLLSISMFLFDLSLFYPNTFSKEPPVFAGDTFLLGFSHYQWFFVPIVFLGLIRMAIHAQKHGPIQFNEEWVLRIRRGMTITIIFGVLYCIVEIANTFLLKPESESRYIITFIGRFILSFLISFFGFEAFATTFVLYNWLTILAGLLGTGTVLILQDMGDGGYSHCYIVWTMGIYMGLLELWIIWKTEDGLVNMGEYLPPIDPRLERRNYNGRFV